MKIFKDQLWDLLMSHNSQAHCSEKRGSFSNLGESPPTLQSDPVCVCVCAFLE